MKRIVQILLDHLMVNIKERKMALKYQILVNEFDEPFIKGWERFTGRLIHIFDVSKADPGIPLIVPANPLGSIGEWMKAKYPFIAVNRPYLGSWVSKRRVAVRVSINSFAPTKLKSIPYSRWNTTRLEKQPWKVKEIKNVLIAPSRKSQGIFTGVDITEWSKKLKIFFESQGVNVKIRYKVGKKGVQHYGNPSVGFKGVFGFDGDFEWADLVVSHSSAITSEAFWYGKKVISLGPCPTWIACESTLANWRDPLEPVNRDVWHEHVAWCQYNVDEWYDGSAQEKALFYQGHPYEVPHDELFNNSQGSIFHAGNP